MNTKPLIAPSMLSCDFGRIYEEVEMVNSSEADWIHLDVMDGNFVPNISFGLPVIKAMASKATKPLDVHLMIEKPERYIEDFRKSGADIITVHYEACTHLHRTIQQIKACGAKAGVVLNPHTSVELLNPILQELDLVLIMSVNPGYGGQRFIENALKKVSQLKRMIIEVGTHCLIEVDGGVNLETGAELVNAGADVLVAGSFVFGSPNPKKTIQELKSLTKSNISA